ncbi:hypothetical protein CDCA_CDCA03G1012 [Cyanidium caldarium]|uniref:2-amino-3-ketobutyrate coenzyme A ligase, mitochondrial n=1 Tax=Cyanidium caldarium TaxID=2771 RepID=A0AAV9IRK7_CYACA|nr:hypothetical protein CDCA_CDCA03G1012 [Cyanidium caldarium]
MNTIFGRRVWEALGRGCALTRDASRCSPLRSKGAFSLSSLGGPSRPAVRHLSGGTDASEKSSKYCWRETDLATHVQSELASIQADGLYKTERVLLSPQGAHIVVETEKAQGSPLQVINFCANNYLGLANHPAVKAAAVDALDTHGYGLASVRFICGTQDLHRDLERKLSAFHSTEDTILYHSCFGANEGLFEVLLGPEDAVISDALNHASVIDGIRLCKAKRYRYRHTDANDLEAQLKRADEEGARHKLIATDGVFSMDGDLAPLEEICFLADQYKAYVMVDDCHATGFIGARGRGTPELFGVQDRVDLVTSTLGKAMGGAAGGYTTGRAEIIELLRQRSRPYLFSNALPPPVVAGSHAVLDLLMKKSPPNAAAEATAAAAPSKAGEAEQQPKLEAAELRARLSRNTKQFRSKMAAAGFTLGGETHPIVPVMVGDARLASEIADDLLDEGIYVIGFSYPVVPKDKARIRVQLSAAHSTEDIEKCVAAFTKVAKARKLIS